MSYTRAAKRLHELGKKTQEQKLDKANEILSDLDKAMVLGNPTPEELADKYFTHALMNMKNHDHEYIKKRLGLDTVFIELTKPELALMGDSLAETYESYMEDGEIALFDNVHTEKTFNELTKKIEENE